MLVSLLFAAIGLAADDPSTPWDETAVDAYKMLAISASAEDTRSAQDASLRSAMAVKTAALQSLDAQLRAVIGEELASASAAQDLLVSLYIAQAEAVERSDIPSYLTAKQGRVYERALADKGLVWRERATALAEDASLSPPLSEL
jgi:hypothetical protein